MIIEGNKSYIKDPEFTDKINKALVLLHNKGCSAYQTVTTYIVKIRAAEKSGMNVQTKIYDIAKPTFDASLTWLASTIAHDSLHSKQYQNKETYYGAESELKCNNYQLNVLRLIGAPADEITYLQSIIKNGDHSDLDGDGKYTEKDYKLRKW